MNRQQRRPIAAPTDMLPQQAARPLPRAQTDAKYITIGVPSGFQWYEYKQLSIRPLGVKEIKKIHSAHVTNDIRMLYEAIGACIDQDIFDMTIGDSYAVMFWLRLNSYPRTPYNIKFQCTDPTHIHHTLADPEEGDDWKRMPVESLKNSFDISATHIEEVKMRPLEEIAEFMTNMELAKRGVCFTPGRVRDLVEIDELAAESWFDPGDDWLCRLASYLDPRHGITLRERFEFVTNSPDVFTPDDTLDMEAMIDLLTHGVRETVQLNCKGCSASNTVEVPIDARTFLPHLYPV